MPGQTHIALLRGINVGGKNKLPMKDLAALFRDAGCDRVQTYIQSGNVVFQATPALASCIPALIAKAISESFGYRVPVVTRTADELREIARGNPFLRSGADPWTCPPPPESPSSIPRARPRTNFWSAVVRSISTVRAAWPASN